MKKTTVFFVLISIGAIIGLAMLGLWQVSRLEWKSELQKKIDAKYYGPISKLPKEVQTNDIYGKYDIEGKFDKTQLFLFSGPKTKLGQGYFVLVPLISKDGRTILINRGFVASKHEAEIAFANRDVAISSGKLIKVTGRLMPNSQINSFTPKNDYDKNILFYIDTNEIAEKIGAKLEEFYLIELSESSPLQKLDMNAKLKNDHLIYAITWFMLAGIVAIWCFFYVNKRRNDEK